MRYVFRRRIPEFDRVLLVESGSRGIAERVLPVLRRNHGDNLQIDIVTCYAGSPGGSAPETVVFHVSDYPGRAGFKRLCGELLARRYPALGIICSGEPIMTRWKWALAARLPAKVFIINENGDYFWFDYSNWRIIAYFALLRTGLAGPGALRSLARLALFPFTLLYLLLYAAAVHLRRAARNCGF
ncbi:MAG TPA: hypothetical protein PLP04_12180 [Bryobacteraceae bacterium]|nr:hypothetical protein [Bryobacteraceae bacterium]HOL70740.1 hypothetical protein [Bryobacteraceae bacterium]HPQ15982.1 hypothetical protein [Bryobacteraceae bacterium]